MADAGEPGLAAFTVDVDKAMNKGKDGKKAPSDKYSEFFSAIKKSVYPNGILDEQTDLGWDNIEGEVMTEMLTAELAAGKMFTQIEHPVFRFADPDLIATVVFARMFVETINRNPHLFPGMTVMKRALNELLISWNRQGRKEQVAIAQAVTVSIADTEKNDTTAKNLFGR